MSAERNIIYQEFYNKTEISEFLIKKKKSFRRFSVKVLMSLCQQSEGQPLAGVIVIGDGHSARAIALAGSSMGLPVLWAKGGTANLDGMHREVSTQTVHLFFFPLEVFVAQLFVYL